MKLIVGKDIDFDRAVKLIFTYPYRADDTETTGLYPYNGDKLFCITVSIPEYDFYFDFHDLQNNSWKLDRKLIPQLYHGYKGTIFAHNAKFDMHFLANEGVDVRSLSWHCTEAVARLVNNEYPMLTLKYLAKTIGLEKDDAVDKYIKEHKLYRERQGIVTDFYTDDEVEKEKRYDLVPFEIISKYAMIDTNITLQLGMYQIQSLNDQAELIKKQCPTLQKDRTLLSLLNVERELTKTLFGMERRGVKIDKDYVKAAFEYEILQYRGIAQLFKEWSGIEFRDDKSTLVDAFKRAGEKIALTEKGNPKLDKATLEKMTSPLAIMVQDYRKAYKMAHTYYQNFLFFADEQGIIHPNFQQGGAKTGRLSCREPNMQNQPAKGEDKSKFPVRKCFMPIEGTYWFSLDWKQIEYRLMLDYAGEMTLIEKIKNGYDVHQATAELVNMERKLAKNVNFALLYGTGNSHFAEMIHKTLLEAKKIRYSYFNALPKVRRFIDSVKLAVERRGYLITHFGRKLKVDKDKSYVGPNYLIQGGCADIMKIALILIDKLLQGKKSFLTLSVHDEADLNIFPDELYLVDEIKKIMSNVYQHKLLPMGVDVEYSTKNWHELKEYKNGSNA